MTDHADRDGLRRLAAALPEGAVVPVPVGWLRELLDPATMGNRPAGASESPAPAPDTPERLVTVNEAAARMAVSPRWLYRHHGELPFTRSLGKRTLRFVESELEAWLAQRPQRAQRGLAA